MINQIIEELQNKKIVILGFGKEGQSTYRFIRKYLSDIPLTIRDKNKDISSSFLLKKDTNIEIITGDNYLEHLEEYDIIMKAPGISFRDLDTSLLKNKIYSQLEFLLKYSKNTIIGITGTKGKSTTSSLIYDVLKNNNKKCLLLGNIGNPIFDYLEEMNKDTILVVEMSSHQLEFIHYSPNIAIITNFYEDHLDHTNGVDDYYQSKLNITRYQTEKDTLIYFEECEILDKYIKKLSPKSNILKVSFTNQLGKACCNDKFIYVDKRAVYDISNSRNLIGHHNLINIMFAFTIGNLLQLDNEKTIFSVNHFKPLEHRLEKVGTYDKITYYNDAIATIPDATINGIIALGNVNTLIFGGLDRGIHYEQFIEYLNTSSVENLICMPSTGHMIANELMKKKTKKNLYLVNTLEEAVKKAKLVTKKDTICLMSPAAASYEYFKNFEEKGKAFKNLVKNEK